MTEVFRFKGRVKSISVVKGSGWALSFVQGETFD